MLKKLRIAVSIIFFTFITLYFLDFAGILPEWLNWAVKIQFASALLAFNFGVLAVLILITLLFGRIYCSSICPMGVFQDIVGWFSKRTGKKKKRYKYAPPKNILRWSILGVTIFLFIIGFPAFLGLIEPYSAFGRMIVNVFKPIYLAGNNLLSYLFSSFGNYIFYHVNVSIISIFSFVIGMVTFFTIGFLAWRYGRSYCNAICPVGTVLGFLSKFSLFKTRINQEKCNSCRLCAIKCKASCIDAASKKIDHSRCVNCFNCLNICTRDALQYSLSVKKKITVEEKNNGRRQFLLTSLASIATIPTAMAQEKTGLFVTPEKSSARETAIAPPGALSVKHLQQHCTSCHLCISKCPLNVLKPAFLEYGLEGLMQPVMYFKKGFCNYDCIICSNVCPNGALQPLTIEEKHATQVGRVVLRWGRCVVRTDETSCGACAEHCPTQAVKMIPFRNGLTRPVVDTEICVGCGGCEFICPVRPHTAIFVEGNNIHQEAKIVIDEKNKDLIIDDFGF
ncbi:MAG: 4Fe-4S dicluster domain-containing protein [Bacteroidales bacterium]|jgi:polyferredoxin|nr:4Fe-4S dicluster domain-containing protein [Bacteroidales bacterium]